MSYEIMEPLVVIISLASLNIDIFDFSFWFEI